MLNLIFKVVNYIESILDSHKAERDIANHALWLSGNIFYKPAILSFMILNKKDYSYKNLNQIITFSSRFIGTKFNKCSLKNAELTWSDLTNASFIEADLENVKLSGSRLINANFYKAKLKKVNFGFCDLYGTNFIEADLTDAIDLAIAKNINKATFDSDPEINKIIIRMILSKKR